jgi:hypothetical protein
MHDQPRGRTACRCCADHVPGRHILPGGHVLAADGVRGDAGAPSPKRLLAHRHFIGPEVAGALGGLRARLPPLIGGEGRATAIDA